MMGLICPGDISSDIIVCDSTGSKVSSGLEVVDKHLVGDCVGGIKFISPAQFEANIDMRNKDDNRLKPRGQSNPHLRVSNLVVYASDAERDEVCLFLETITLRCFIVHVVACDCYYYIYIDFLLLFQLISDIIFSV